MELTGIIRLFSLYFGTISDHNIEIIEGGDKKDAFVFNHVSRE